MIQMALDNTLIPRRRNTVDLTRKKKEYTAAAILNHYGELQVVMHSKRVTKELNSPVAEL